MKNLIKRVRSSGKTFKPDLMASAANLVKIQLDGATVAEKTMINYAGVARDLLPPGTFLLGDDFREFALADDPCAHVVAYWMNNRHPVRCKQLANGLDAIDYLTGKTCDFEQELETLCAEVERAL